MTYPYHLTSEYVLTCASAVLSVLTMICVLWYFRICVLWYFRRSKSSTKEHVKATTTQVTNRDGRTIDGENVEKITSALGQVDGLIGELLPGPELVIDMPLYSRPPGIPEDPSTTTDLAQEMTGIGIPYVQFRSAVRMLIADGMSETRAAWAVRSFVIGLHSASGDVAAWLRKRKATLDHVRAGEATLVDVARALDPIRQKTTTEELVKAVGYMLTPDGYQCLMLLSRERSDGDPAMTPESIALHQRIFEVSISEDRSAFVAGAYYVLRGEGLTIHEVDGVMVAAFAPGWISIKDNGPLVNPKKSR